MTDAYQPEEEIAVDNDRALKKLTRAITHSQGNFALILVRCNYSDLRDRMVRRLKEICPVEIRELYLSTSVKTLYTTIQVELGDDQPQALMIFDLDRVRAINQVLSSTNQVRDDFRKFSFPIVLWINDEILQNLTQFAIDFKSWAAVSIKFEIESDSLIDKIRQTTDTAFAAIVTLGAGKFPNVTSLLDFDDRLELESALSDLRERDTKKIYPELEAGLEFLIGREADINGSKEQARERYEQSLQFWQKQVQTNSPLETDLTWYGCLHFHLGLWWRRYATQYSKERESSYLRAKEFFQQGLNAFQRGDRSDLAANFIDALGEVLTRLHQWEELEALVPTVLQLHKTYPEPIRLAYAYGLRAELALSKSDWSNAKHDSELALQTNEEPSSSAIDWSWEQQHYRNLYLLLMAEAQRHLNQPAEAIANLEAAQIGSNPQHDPILHIRILEALRSLYFEQGQYQKAFRTKQHQRTIEQQYELRAFTGAGRLQPKQLVVNPALAPSEQQEIITQEIAASGRQQDIQRLVERISRADHKLTIIYGQSGVGKSSIVQAGLVPTLKQIMVEARDVVPVLLQSYTDWDRSLRKNLSETLGEASETNFSILTDSAQETLNKLQNDADRSHLIVLIFDQFEEFFFVHKDFSRRRRFYQFLSQCLEISFVKIILSIREDYLHYLLEFNRLANLEVINNNILDKGILYYLGNFSQEDAKSVIETLTGRSQFYLEPALIESLVHDLSGEAGEVRPIELQVVGAQLQTENITTLEQYKKYGPKGKLVERFLEEVIRDCGNENEHIARIVLYLLTDENGTRPLKTRTEIEAELEALAQTKSKQLDVVLEIFVKSGLVFLVPETPADRYQLVHDYLVSFIRQQQSAELTEELQKEREQRKRSEAELNRILKRQLRIAVVAGALMSGLALLAGIFGVRSMIGETDARLNALSASSEGLFASNKGMEALIESLKAVKKLKASFGVAPDARLKVLTSLQEAVYNVREQNRLEGHTDQVNQVVFSPDGKLIASASKDKTIHVWNLSGEAIATLRGHKGSVTSISFSTDSHLLASGSDDKTVRLWDLTNRKEIIILKGHTKKITSVSVSSDGRIVASGSDDKTIKIWSTAGKLLKTLIGHQGAVTSVAFSPHSELLASASDDRTMKLWKSGGKLIRTFQGGREGITNLSFNPEGNRLISFNSGVISNEAKLWSLDGTLIKIDYFLSNSRLLAGGFSPDGKTIASINQRDSTIQLWRYRKDTKWLEEPEILYGHSSDVTSVNFSPDGKVLASAGKDNTVRLWQLTGNEFKTDENEHVTSISFSPNSKTLAASSDDNTVKLWQRNGTLLQTLLGFSSSVSFSPDGKLIASAGCDDAIKLWRQNGTVEGILSGHNSTVNSVSFSPDGELIASASDDKTVKLWHRNGTLFKTLVGHRKQVTSVVFSSDSQLLASVSKDNTVKLWRRDGTAIATLKGHLSQVYSALFSPDSQLVASVGNDNLVHVWRKDGTLIKTFQAFSSSTYGDIGFSDDSKIIASAAGLPYSGKSELKLWQLDGKLLKTVDDFSGWSEGFSPSKQIVASRQQDYTIGLWNFNGTSLASLKGHLSWVENISFSLDDRTIATSSNDRTVKLWDSNGTLLKTIEVKVNQPPNVNLSPDGKLLTIIGEETDSGNRNIIKLVHRDDSKTSTFPGESLTNIVSFSPDSQTIALDNADNVVKIWRSDGTLVTLLRGHTGKITSVTFSPDGNLIASASDDKTVKLWRSNGTLLKTFTEHSGKINSVSFSPNGNLIASASDDKTIKLWHSDDDTPPITLVGHKSNVNSVTFSPDGQLILSASKDSTLKLWSLNGKEINTLKGHSGEVKDVSFSPDGQFIISAGTDTVKLWKRDGTLLKTFQSFNTRGGSSPQSSGGINARFSPDGKAIAFDGQEGLLLWSLEPDELMSRGCRWARNYLKTNPNVEETDRYLCDGINTVLVDKK